MRVGGQPSSSRSCAMIRAVGTRKLEVNITYNATILCQSTQRECLFGSWNGLVDLRSPIFHVRKERTKSRYEWHQERNFLNSVTALKAGSFCLFFSSLIYHISVILSQNFLRDFRSLTVVLTFASSLQSQHEVVRYSPSGFEPDRNCHCDIHQQHRGLDNYHCQALDNILSRGNNPHLWVSHCVTSESLMIFANISDAEPRPTQQLLTRLSPSLIVIVP